MRNVDIDDFWARFILFGLLFGVLAALGWMGWFITTSQIQSSHRYNHDLYLALAGRESQVRFYPETVPQAKLVQELVAGTTAPTGEVMQALGRLEDWKVGDFGKLLSSGEVNEKDREAFRILQGKRTPEETAILFTKLQSVNGNLTDFELNLFDVLEGERGDVAKIIAGDFSEDQLPQRLTYTKFTPWVIVFIWLFTTALTFLFYVLWCVYNNEDWYALPWREGWPAVVMAVFLPGFLLTALFTPRALWWCWHTARGLVLVRLSIKEETQSSGAARPSPPPPLREAIAANLADVSILEQQRIPFARERIAFPSRRNVITFERQHRARILEALGLHARRREETNVQNLRLLECWSPGQEREKGTARLTRNRTRYLSRYAQACKGRLVRDRELAQKDLQDAQRIIEECQRTIGGQTQRSQQARDLLSHVEHEEQEGRNADCLKNEFDELCSLSEVAWVEVDDSRLRIFTACLRMNGHPIGELEIAIPFSARSHRDIRIQNRWGQLSGYNHPHVDRSGIVLCPGEIGGSIEQALLGRQYAVAVAELLHLLVNINNPHFAPRQWKEGWWHEL